MTEYTSDELLHERKMQEDGVERYWNQALRFREKDTAAVNIPERSLIRKYVKPLSEEIRAWLKQAKKAPGPNHLGAPYVSRIPSEVAALMGLSCVLDTLTKNVTLLSLGGRIGRLMEDEDRLRKCKLADSASWKDMARRKYLRYEGTHVKKRAMQEKMKRLELLPPRWPVKEKQAAGLAVLECLCKISNLVEVFTIKGPRRQRHMVRMTQATAEWLAKADEAAAQALPMYRPTIEKPVDWEGPAGGGYKTDLVLKRSLARFQGSGHRALVDKTDPAQYQTVLDATNKLQGIGWTINNDVLEVAKDCLDRGGAPLDRLTQIEMPPMPGPDPTDKQLSKWRYKLRVLKGLNAGRAGRRILAHQTIGQAKAMQAYQQFYMPHRLDFRGRSYPSPVWLQPQGHDLARGLLQFAEAEPLTAEGWKALMAWGEECGDEMATVEVAKAVYQDPIANPLWTGEEIKKPWQFLAWCLEVGSAIESGFPNRPFLTRLPCYIDASNNGLQLYSLMTGDRELAEWTNCLPGEKRDLYRIVGGEGWRRLQQLAATGSIPAAEWQDLLLDGIPRDCAKRPVMTRPYNVTSWSAADYIRDWYRDTYTSIQDLAGPIKHQQKRCRWLAALLLKCVDDCCPAAVAGMDWLRVVAEACAERGVVTRWTNPVGWPVQQEYRDRRKYKVAALFGGSLKTITVYDDGPGITDRVRQARAVAPNFVHSVDSAVMSTAVMNFDGPIAAIHDAFGTTASRLPELHRVLRRAVVEVVLEKDPFGALQAEVQDYIGRRIPDPPRRGTIDPSEVLESQYLFS